jgi:hypothetical protein
MSIITITFKLLLSMAFDIFDFFFRIPGLGTILDIAGGILGIILWGKLGSAQFLEVIDITDQIDGFIPTLTIIALISIFKDY